MALITLVYRMSARYVTTNMHTIAVVSFRMVILLLVHLNSSMEMIRMLMVVANGEMYIA